MDCYLFLSAAYSLEYEVDIDMDHLNFETGNGYSINLKINKSNGFIAFEAIQVLKQPYSEKNIILLANDVSFESVLEELKNKGANMIVATLNPGQGRHLHSMFQWGDISLPLGLAFGLTKMEL